MRYLSLIITVFSLFSFVSCIEIIEDLSINSDGSGTMKLNINLSSSKTKINGVLALDSLDGKKIPTRTEIKDKINLYENRIGDQEGLSNVNSTIDLDNYLIKLSFDFEKLEDIQKGLTAILKEDGSKNLEKLEAQSWVNYNDSVLERKAIPLLDLFKDKIKPSDRERLKEGKYISITRFNQEVVSVSNPGAKISSNKKAVMVPYSPSALLSGKESIGNVIVLIEN